MNFTSLRLRKIKVSFHLFSSNNNIWMCFHNENIWNKWVYDTTSISVWKQDESTMAMTNEKIRVNERTSVAKVKKRMFYQVVVSAHTLTHKQNHYSWLAGIGNTLRFVVIQRQVKQREYAFYPTISRNKLCLFIYFCIQKSL